MFPLHCKKQPLICACLSDIRAFDESDAVTLTIFEYIVTARNAPSADYTDYIDDVVEECPNLYLPVRAIDESNAVTISSRNAPSDDTPS